MINDSNERFTNAYNFVMGSDTAKSGIGTLAERKLHIILKHFFEPNAINHEIKVGTYYVDILNDNGIIEIQTGNFQALRKKLAYLLEISKVTIVYPIAFNKWLIWLNKETGEVTQKRKSPKTGTKYQIFYELYKIKQLLTHPNLRLEVLLLNIDEYRYLDGWSIDKKRGSTRFERIPQAIIEQISINSVSEHINLIPDNMSESFTSKNFQKASALNLRNSQIALNVLKYIGTIEQAGKDKNCIVYKISK